MDLGPTLLHWLIGAVAIVGMFMILVAPHEAGHMLVAKAVGVRVYEYAIGMGTKLWSYTRNTTMYALRLIPFGGYVRLAGMDEGDFDAADGFHTKPALGRLSILLAGPAVNFVIAALLFTCYSLSLVNSDPGKVQIVYQGEPAYQAGIRPGDSIQTVDGQRITYPDQIRQIEQRDPTKPLVLTIRRPDGSTYRTTMTPQWDKQDKAYLIGVVPMGVMTPLQAVTAGVKFPVVATGAIFQGIGELITGQIKGGILGPGGVTGAVGIGYLTYTTANEGFFQWLQLAALLSVALGIGNLLPLPALDGGRIVVVLAEVLRGRPFDREREMAIQRAGLMALLALMVFIAALDVQRIATGEFSGLK